MTLYMPSKIVFEMKKLLSDKSENFFLNIDSLCTMVGISYMIIARRPLNFIDMFLR